MTRRPTRVWNLPTEGWSWRGTLLVGALLLSPYLLTPAIHGPASHAFQLAGSMSLLLQNIAIFLAGVTLKYHWRMTTNATTGWLALALAFLAVQNLPFALLDVSGSPVGAYGHIVGVAQVPIGVITLVLLTLASGRFGPPRHNPLSVGIFLGATVGAARLALTTNNLDPSHRLSTAESALLTVVVLLIVGGAIRALAVASDLPLWARSRIAVAAVGLTLGSTITLGEGISSPSPVSVAVGAVATVLLACTSLALLRVGLTENTNRMVALAARAATAEAHVRHGKERLHELNATIGGVAVASRLLLQPRGGPTGRKRAQLEAMLESEMARLERMLSDRGDKPVGVVRLDEVLLPLVVAERSLGHPVHWESSGLSAVGRADDIAEVVHILLANAARHAPGCVTELSVRPLEETVEIWVADNGPGVPDSVRNTLFEWGSRGPGSPGQGIGLQLARRLMIEQGGQLRLEESSPRGAVFVATLPGALAEEP